MPTTDNVVALKTRPEGDYALVNLCALHSLLRPYRASALHGIPFFLIGKVQPGNLVYTPPKQIAEQMSFSLRTVNKHLKTLESLHFLTPLKNHKAYFWLSTTYVIKEEGMNEEC